MVMDMFFVHVEVEKKKRVHFHGFMLDVHESKLVISRLCYLGLCINYKVHYGPSVYLVPLKKKAYVEQALVH